MAVKTSEKKVKEVKAWAVCHTNGEIASLWGCLIYHTKFEALKRIKGSPVMLAKGFKVIRVSIKEIK